MILLLLLLIVGLLFVTRVKLRVFDDHAELHLARPSIDAVNLVSPFKLKDADMNFCRKCKNSDLVLIEVVAIVIVFNILHLANVCNGPPFLNKARALLKPSLVTYNIGILD